ncbi:unnamed protein product [Blepharisma stoltei]|uniref:Methyltransferase domain-containing protein n=1 Tax=Blepharisma stoltei TaxID=1481888 RepID=A0AAU9J7Z9_9CILI|nr:unnamed protein product [Blepharisma stoltei]
MRIARFISRSFAEKRSYSRVPAKAPEMPKYLTETYWWAYVHPNAVWFFERQWLVNLILWGNFNRLRDYALNEITFPSKTLQVACVYGNFTQKLTKLSNSNSEVHVVDVAEIQLENLKEKCKNATNLHLHHQDSTNLAFEDNVFDNTVLYFLLHEQPEEARKLTISEAVRVTKPGGKVVFVDYHGPSKLNPFRYIMIPILRTLEPFALDLWKKEIKDWLPQVTEVKKDTYFGGLYQKIVVKK